MAASRVAIGPCAGCLLGSQVAAEPQWQNVRDRRSLSRVFHVRMPFSVGVYLVDGVGAGAWSVRDGRIVLDPFRDLTPAEARAVEREREALEAFHA